METLRPIKAAQHLNPKPPHKLKPHRLAFTMTLKQNKLVSGSSMDQKFRLLGSGLASSITTRATKIPSTTAPSSWGLGFGVYGLGMRAG